MPDALTYSQRLGLRSWTCTLPKLVTMWAPLASASVVFLVLYFFIFLVLSTLFALKKVSWRSRWTVLFLHVLVRLASQACGLAFGMAGYRNIHILVAYYILGAEGYFTLVICTARFLIAWQRNHWDQYSWIEPVDPTQERAGWAMRLKRMFQWKSDDHEPAGNKFVAAFDWLLAAANAIIIAGGSISAGAYTDKDLSQSQIKSKLDTSKGLRAAGQAVFLVVNTVLLVCIAVTIHQHTHYRFDQATEIQLKSPVGEKVQMQDNQHRKPRPWYAHPVLLLLLATWPFLAVRGGFGVAQALVPDLNVSTTKGRWMQTFNWFADCVFVSYAVLQLGRL